MHTLGLLSFSVYLHWHFKGLDLSLAGYLSGIFSLWAFLGVGWWALEKRKESLGGDWNLGKFRTILILWAILFRLVGLFSEPIFEDDWARYLWDGKMSAEKGNPYISTPLEEFRDSEHREPEWQKILSSINHPDYPTIYFPVLQFFFLLGFFLSPGDTLGLGLLYLLLDLGNFYLLTKILRHRLKLFFLFSWCPLWIQEIHFSLHPETIGIFFLILGIYFYQKKKEILFSIFWGLSLAAKPFVLFLIPFILGRLPNKRSLGMILRISLVFCVTWLPFLVSTDEEKSFQLTNIFQFLGNFEFNSSCFAILQFFLGFQWAKNTAFAFFLGFYFLVWWQKAPIQNIREIPIAGIFAVFLLLSSVANPWYLLWALPFLGGNSFRDGLPGINYWILGWLILVSLSYITGKNMGDSELGVYDHPNWVRWLEFLPLLPLIYLGLRK